MILARLFVIAELCLAGGTGAAVVAGLRAAGRPSTAELLAVAGAVLACSAQVVALCARWSIRRPYAAALRDARDQPAPPVAMTGYSARLALSTTSTGLLLSLLAGLGFTVAVVAATAALILLALRRITVQVRTWDDLAVRSRVLNTVSAG
jgi:hypothetical protein